jgi:hypothetical protein
MLPQVQHCSASLPQLLIPSQLNLLICFVRMIGAAKISCTPSARCMRTVSGIFGHCQHFACGELWLGSWRGVVGTIFTKNICPIAAGFVVLELVSFFAVCLAWCCVSVQACCCATAPRKFYSNVIITILWRTLLIFFFEYIAAPDSKVQRECMGQVQ